MNFNNMSIEFYSHIIISLKSYIGNIVESVLSRLILDYGFLKKNC